MRTGFKTRNVLCQPVRAHRGGGEIVAVIQMLNKNDGGQFDSNDEDTLLLCTQRVADDLGSRFKELLSAASKFVGSAIFIGEKSGKPTDKSTLTAPTVASIAGRYDKPQENFMTDLRK